MALTYGQMRDQILQETYRTGNPAFVVAVQNALVSAVKELETEQLFINTDYVELEVAANQLEVLLPEQFVSVLSLVLLDQNRNMVATPASGFKEVTFWELLTYRWQQYTPGITSSWAIYGNKLHLWPVPPNPSFLQMYYYKRDGYYPIDNPPDDPTEPQQPWDEDTYNMTSIWLGDFTQDVTRYTARKIFYRDSLQSPELGDAEEKKKLDALSQLRVRNSQRSTTQYMSY